METWDEETHYAPYSGEVLPNGNLRVPTFGRFTTGEVWDGAIEVAPEHPNYSLWLSQIKNKLEYWAAVEEARRSAREQRRRKRKLGV